MTDLGKIKLCAEAIGHRWYAEGERLWLLLENDKVQPFYDPFHNDAQAMVLEDWLIEHVRVLSYYSRKLRVVPVTHADVWDFSAATKEERRRAIVECVAKMQVAKP